ncbi:DUF4407 domain-containing protein [Planomonospora corallina]|uniref:DUF4407 domain-containing protein n=1 Tax=Planomonospora corallina TaxID=1806052 RepID=A0ABV8I348_9ACTN
MAETVDQVTGPAGGPPPRPPRSTRRPRGRGRAGRLLRSVVGVDEGLLARVPEERARYTRQGALVVATALMAAVSMGYALQSVFDAPWPLVVLIALAWGALIGILDSWLVISVNGVVGRGRRRMLLPRLLIAVVVGVIIAEPLTLRIFESAILQRIAQDQQEADKILRSTYTACNPKVGEPAADPQRCATFRLNLPKSNDAVALESLERRLADLTEEVDEKQRLLDRKARTARLECVGTRGAGLTGRPGPGVNCRRLRADVREYRRTSNIEQLSAQLEVLGKQRLELSSAERESGAEYNARVTAAIDAELRRQQEARPDSPGLLERMETLATLSAEKSSIMFAHVFLTLLFLLIDCSPVLTKLLSRPTSYDRRLAEQLADREEAHTIDLDRGKRVRRDADEIHAHQSDLRLREHLTAAARRAGILDARREAAIRAELGTIENGRSPEKAEQN